MTRTPDPAASESLDGHGRPGVLTLPRQRRRQPSRPANIAKVSPSAGGRGRWLRCGGGAGTRDG